MRSDYIGNSGGPSIDLSTVWLIMPAFNEGAVISKTVTDVTRHFPNVAVIDDCSGDDTALHASAAGAIVLRHAINLGQGAALQTGIDFAIAKGASAIVTFDSDGQHNVHDALRMVGALQSTNVDVVLGSRFLGDAEGVTATKRLFLKMAVLFTRLSTGLALTDTHNGLRVFGSRAIAGIRIQQNRMAHASELLETIARLHLTYIELPVTITYTKYSVAKGQRMSGAANILFDLFVRKLYK